MECTRSISDLGYQDPEQSATFVCSQVAQYYSLGTAFSMSTDFRVARSESTCYGRPVLHRPDQTQNQRESGPALECFFFFFYLFSIKSMFLFAIE